MQLQYFFDVSGSLCRAMNLHTERRCERAGDPVAVPGIGAIRLCTHHAHMLAAGAKLLALSWRNYKETQTVQRLVPE